MNKDSRIFIAGHRGMVGSAISRKLKQEGFTNLIEVSSQALDLRNQYAVDTFFIEQKPEYVFLAAAKVGGILANRSYPAEFLYDNVMIEANVIHASYVHAVKKLMFLGSSCIYPKFAEQPIKESSLLSGYLESSNEAYAIAKIAGVKMCQAYQNQYGCNFISVMPTNLYGYGDYYHPQNSHVLPGMILRFHEAKVKNHKSVSIWGTGAPLREFMFADDLADACHFLMLHYNSPDIINVGTGEEISILDLAKRVGEAVGFDGEIVLDVSKPDGTPRKLMDSTKFKALGFKPKIKLDEGIKLAYQDFLKKYPIQYPL